MPKRRAPSPVSRKPSNQRRKRSSISEAIRRANRRAHEKANRRGSRRQLKSVRAAIAATDHEVIDAGSLSLRILRWLIGLLLLPACWVTTWTFLAHFSDATLHRGFWQTPAFWYFVTGALLTAGWLGSGLLRNFFLYLYVLGHELTHAIFVLLFRGRVSGIHVSSSGGYITTNKTNLVIALSPYFVPFWSLVVGALFVAARLIWQVDGYWNLAFYALIGSSWSFHMLWTLWMIPRDQPDLRENGTFLSLVVIYLANLLLLVMLLCAAHASPLASAREFGMDWSRNAILFGDATLRWLHDIADSLRGQIRL
ncbi:MAG: hypothetical protein R3242_00340 [Akkermansiaceae bacterium]|nr:hypothetical protein [Akkermansiaceae bacterium]